MAMFSDSVSRFVPTLPRARRRSLAQMIDLHRQRRALARLDDDALQDIGITRAQAQAEASRPIWDAPDYWR